MNVKFLICSAYLCAFFVLVSTLQCYTCDTTDFINYKSCDKKIKMGTEECIADDGKFPNIEDYACYRTVFMHPKDGIIIERGCQVKKICNNLRRRPHNFMTKNHKFMVLECAVCNTDFCDPKVEPTSGWVAQEEPYCKIKVRRN